MTSVSSFGAAVRARVLGILSAILTYLPIVVLLRYVTWEGEPSGERWVAGFKWCSLIALAHCAVFVTRRKPFDRIALGSDLWVMICGALAWSQAWPALEFFGGHLRETGFWIVVFAASLGATFATPSGLIGANAARSGRLRRYDLYLLTLVALATVVSYYLRGATLLAVVLPVILLSALRSRLASMLVREGRPD